MSKTKKPKSEKQPPNLAASPPHEPSKPTVAPKTAKRPKQATLPGVEAKTPAKVEKAVLAYQEARDERMEHTKLESEAYAKMLASMQEAALDLKQPFSFVRDDGKRVQVFPDVKPEEFKVRVKLVDEDEE